ncbi:MAG: hypothetical protein JXD23_13175 [Spirochaetales bacterium]|nr:hypothetical protein [Spirochaetales bacterium]
MNLSIKPVHYEFLSCLEDSIIAVAEWAHYRYELIFCEDWYFDFNPGPDRPLGDSLPVFRNDVVGKLDAYHGIKTLYGKASPAEILDVVESELKDNRPIMVSIDSYLCPWDWNYLKTHFHHYYLITGSDDDGNYSYCDRFFKASGTMTKENLIQGYLNDYRTFRFEGGERIHVRWGEILANSVNRLMNGAGNGNAFGAMRDFAESVEGSTDIQKEIEGHEDFLFIAPLIKNLEDIAYGRRRFAKLLDYFGAETDVEGFRETSAGLIKAASQWANIRAILIKAAFSRDVSLKNKAANKIRDVAVLEEDIAGRVRRMYQDKADASGSFSNRQVVSHEATEGDVAAVGRKIRFVDLSPYLNNKAFGATVSMDCPADLMGTGTYFLKENFPDHEHRIWTVKDMAFQVPWLYGNGNDNIACSGQEISIDDDVFRNIMILGCADWGNYVERFLIRYDDGRTEEIPVRITDYLYEPVYGETIAWEGKAVEKINDRVQLRGRKVYISAQNHEIAAEGRIRYLRLPDVPGIHIFAISLA